MVVIAQYLDGSAADAAADLLDKTGIRANVLDLCGPRAPGIIQVLVPAAQSVRAYGLLRRAERGEFAHGWTGQTEGVQRAAQKLHHSLVGPGAAAHPAWLKWLPVWVVGTAVAGLLTTVVIVGLIQETLIR